jgi:hypothetical protein
MAKRYLLSEQGITGQPPCFCSCCLLVFHLAWRYLQRCTGLYLRKHSRHSGYAVNVILHRKCSTLVSLPKVRGPSSPAAVIDSPIDQKIDKINKNIHLIKDAGMQLVLDAKTPSRGAYSCFLSLGSTLQFTISSSPSWSPNLSLTPNS